MVTQCLIGPPRPLGRPTPRVTNPRPLAPPVSWCIGYGVCTSPLVTRLGVERGFESLLLRQYDQRVSRRALTVVIALGACLIGAPAPAATTTAKRPPKVIRLVSISTADRSVDVEPKGNSVGDHETFASRLLNQQAQFGKKKGAVVGRDSGSLRLTTKRLIPIFTAEARLPGGTIRTHGRLRPIAGGAYRVAVTGGTGLFEKVQGNLTINPKTKANVYRLLYPLVA